MKSSKALTSTLSPPALGSAVAGEIPTDRVRDNIVSRISLICAIGELIRVF